MRLRQEHGGAGRTSRPISIALLHGDITQLSAYFANSTIPTTPNLAPSCLKK